MEIESPLSHSSWILLLKEAFFKMDGISSSGGCLSLQVESCDMGAFMSGHKYLIVCFLELQK